MAKVKKVKKIKEGPICQFCGRPLKLPESIEMQSGKKCRHNAVLKQQMHLDKYFIMEGRE